ncbi:3'-5' exonuclease [Aurantimonas sp. C2-6-R+9]|uniref:3'-5' exonuclease n=1 Tax=unclassified Aurantimonas TaxID=2638230 RepID=UPI002E19FEB7|nr:MULTISPECIES: 3'-5' exonuclease [unclassified Aurantimonas]MEC5293345.1 3'-5' exonuclease [Aurantimonas sp. C2-3-R2]MEC5383844.1 3'-5' exonuclease [Aurantimonas sp. C2-6-R+9]MEC5414428.1 3'-5' exonuclease [Aurantimonas sp. C2-4-R8]
MAGQAKKIHADLERSGVRARLLDEGSASLADGVLVCTPHLAKGLEFDRVLVPDASDAIYSTPMDRNLLYVACTRAMHRLTILVVGTPSAYLPAVG